MTRAYVRTVPHNANAGKAKRSDAQQVALMLIDFARRVRDARLERDITQAELAAAAGVSSVVVNRLERACSPNSGAWQHGPKLGTVIRIALALRLMPSEIMP